RFQALEHLLDRGSHLPDRDAPDAYRIAAFGDAAPALPQPLDAPLEEAVLVAARYVGIPHRAERAKRPEAARARADRRPGPIKSHSGHADQPSNVCDAGVRADEECGAAEQVPHLREIEAPGE